LIGRNYWKYGPDESLKFSASYGLQDYEYFWLLAKKSGGKSTADEWVNGLICKRPFDKSSLARHKKFGRITPKEWDKVRIAVRERIAK
jgi:hypothetical protein